MKKILAAFLTLLSFSGFASHYLGGNISWEKTANGQFIFELRVYKECAAGSASYVATTIYGPQGNIATTVDSIYSYIPQCSGSPVSCNSSSAGVGAVEVHVLKSAPVTLTGTPPATGWTFYWEDNARSFGVVNTNAPTIRFESVMYDKSPSASPVFVDETPYVLTPYNKTWAVPAFKGHSGDSLHYSLVPFKSGTSVPSYNTGYSSVSPLPSNLTNPQNGPVSMDGATGLISYDAPVGISGLYVVSVDVEQWRNGVLTSKVGVEHEILYVNSSISNSAPVVSIDTSLYSDIIQTGPFSYKTYKHIGDSVSFVLSSSDADMNSTTFLPQNITFSAEGFALDMPWGTTGSVYNNTPSINPVAPQTGFVKAGTNNVSFLWTLDNEHFNSYNNSHLFTFTFADDQCPYPGMTSVTLQVVVQKAVSVTSDSVYVCAGDSVQLQGWTNNGSYSWSPIAGLSDDTISNPMASPSASGYYYLSNGNGAVDSVYVQVKQQGTIDLAFANGRLELTDTNGTSNRIWYYNGIPFFYPYDTLTPFGYGDYWVKAQDGPCALFSNVYNINLGHSFSVFDPNNGGYNGTNLPVAGSMGATFSINQGATINSVTIVGLEDLHKSGTGYDLNLKVYDANQVEVFSKDVTLTPPFFGPLHIEIGYAISANADYTVAVSGDTAYSFKLFENVSYPATPHNNGITVKGAYEGAAGQFPTQPSNYLLPFTINTDVQVVSMSEHPAGTFEIYPNPATNGITIGGLKGESEILLLDLNGKLIAKYNTAEKSVAIKTGNIPAGIYFVKITDSNTTELQKVLFK